MTGRTARRASARASPTRRDAWVGEQRRHKGRCHPCRHPIPHPCSPLHEHNERGPVPNGHVHTLEYSRRVRGSRVFRRRGCHLSNSSEGWGGALPVRSPAAVSRHAICGRGHYRGAACTAPRCEGEPQNGSPLASAGWADTLHRREVQDLRAGRRAAQSRRSAPPDRLSSMFGSSADRLSGSRIGGREGGVLAACHAAGRAPGPGARPCAEREARRGRRVPSPAAETSGGLHHSPSEPWPPPSKQQVAGPDRHAVPSATAASHAS